MPRQLCTARQAIESVQLALAFRGHPAGPTIPNNPGFWGQLKNGQVELVADLAFEHKGHATMDLLAIDAGGQIVLILPSLRIINGVIQGGQYLIGHPSDI